MMHSIHCIPCRFIVITKIFLMIGSEKSLVIKGVLFMHYKHIPIQTYNIHYVGESLRLPTPK